MEPSRGEDEESLKTFASEFSSYHGLTCNCSMPCKCNKLDIPSSIGSSQKFRLSEHVLGIVSKTESYLKERRITELVHFLLTKLLADASDKPSEHLIKILDDCMLYRAGFGHLPVLYEERHLEAVVKSFDPSQRGWINAGQLRRAYITLGLNPPKTPDDEKIPTDEFLKNLKRDQENELSELLMAGALIHEESSDGDVSRKNNTPVSPF